MLPHPTNLLLRKKHPSCCTICSLSALFAPALNPLSAPLCKKLFNIAGNAMAEQGHTATKSIRSIYSCNGRWQILTRWWYKQRSERLWWDAGRLERRVHLTSRDYIGFRGNMNSSCWLAGALYIYVCKCTGTNSQSNPDQLLLFSGNRTAWLDPC